MSTTRNTPELKELHEATLVIIRNYFDNARDEVKPGGDIAHPPAIAVKTTTDAGPTIIAMPLFPPNGWNNPDTLAEYGAVITQDPDAEAFAIISHRVHAETSEEGILINLYTLGGYRAMFHRIDTELWTINPAGEDHTSDAPAPFEEDAIRIIRDIRKMHSHKFAKA